MRPLLGSPPQDTRAGNRTDVSSGDALGKRKKKYVHVTLFVSLKAEKIREVFIIRERISSKENIRKKEI